MHNLGLNYLVFGVPARECLGGCFDLLPLQKELEATTTKINILLYATYMNTTQKFKCRQNVFVSWKIYGLKKNPGMYLVFQKKKKTNFLFFLFSDALNSMKTMCERPGGISSPSKRIIWLVESESRISIRNISISYLMNRSLLIIHRTRTRSNVPQWFFDFVFFFFW